MGILLIEILLYRIKVNSIEWMKFENILFYIYKKGE